MIVTRHLTLYNFSGAWCVKLSVNEGRSILSAAKTHPRHCSFQRRSDRT